MCDFLLFLIVIFGINAPRSAFFERDNENSIKVDFFFYFRFFTFPFFFPWFLLLFPFINPPPPFPIAWRMEMFSSTWEGGGSYQTCRPFFFLFIYLHGKSRARDPRKQNIHSNNKTRKDGDNEAKPTVHNKKKKIQFRDPKMQMTFHLFFLFSLFYLRLLTIRTAWKTNEHDRTSIR